MPDTENIDSLRVVPPVPPMPIVSQLREEVRNKPPEICEFLARGALDEDWPALPAYNSPYDATSPWSLVLAWLPKTASTKQLAKFLAAQPLSREQSSVQLGPDIVHYTQQQCLRVGWNPESPASSTTELGLSRDAVDCSYVRIWMRLVDAAGGRLEWPGATDAMMRDSWYRGILRVAALYATYNEGSRLELSVLDQAATGSPEDHLNFLKKLLKSSTTQTIARDVERLAIPFLYYAAGGKFDAFGLWLQAEAECRLPAEMLTMLTALGRIPPLTQAIATAAAKMSLSPAVVQGLQRLSTVLPEDAVCAQDCSFRQCINASEMLGTLVRNPNEVCEIWKGDVLGQKILLAKFANSRPLDRYDIKCLATSVFSKIDSEEIEKSLLRAALQSSRMMYLRKRKWPSHLLATECFKICRQKLAGSDEISEQVLAEVVALLDLVVELDDEEHSPTARVLAEKYRACIQAGSMFSLDLRSLLWATPLSAVRLALDSKPNSYKQSQKLLDLALQFGLEDDTKNRIQVIKICAQAALKAGDIEFANSSLEENKISSVEEDVNIARCESSDESTAVLNTRWDAAESALKQADDTQLPYALATWAKLSNAHQRPATKTRAGESFFERFTSPTAESQEPKGSRGPSRPTAQIKNLMVSGLGWAIGASPEDSNL